MATSSSLVCGTGRAGPCARPQIARNCSVRGRGIVLTTRIAAEARGHSQAGFVPPAMSICHSFWRRDGRDHLPPMNGRATEPRPATRRLTYQAPAPFDVKAEKDILPTEGLR